MIVRAVGPNEKRVNAEYTALSALVFHSHLFNGEFGDIHPELFSRGDSNTPEIQSNIAEAALHRIRSTGGCTVDGLKNDLKLKGFVGSAYDAEVSEIETFCNLATPETLKDSLAILLDKQSINIQLSRKGGTDYDHARRLIVRYGKYIRFNCTQGRWFIWAISHWRVDDNKAIYRIAKETARKIYEEAAVSETKAQQDALAKMASSLMSEAKIRAMLRMAESEPGIAMTEAQFDQNNWLLACRNGTIDLRTGKLRPSCREDFITRLAPVVYDPDAKCPIFDKFLDETTSGRKDVARYLLQFLGYSLTGDISEQVLPVWWGEGSNGKNTLFNIVLSIMGDYAGPSAPELLVAKRWTQHPTEIADLHGKRLVIASETAKGQPLRTQFVKATTGDKMLKARRMFQDFFEFERTHKTILVTNHRPTIDEQSHAIWRRIHLIPFLNVVSAEDEDKRLDEKLLSEDSGVLNRLIHGCLDWQENGLVVPSDVRVATEEYRAECDYLAQFLDEYLSFIPGAWTSSSRLNEAFGSWCRDHHIEPSHKELHPRLRQNGAEPKNVKGRGRGWSGVSLLTDQIDVPD